MSDPFNREVRVWITDLQRHTRPVSIAIGELVGSSEDREKLHLSPREARKLARGLQEQGFGVLTNEQVRIVFRCITCDFHTGRWQGRECALPVPLLNNRVALPETKIPPHCPLRAGDVGVRYTLQERE
jgi:hypothetical protein